MGLKNIEKAQVLRLGDEVEYQQGQIVSKTLAQNRALSMTLFAFEQDEEISTHTPTATRSSPCSTARAASPSTARRTSSPPGRASSCRRTCRTRSMGRHASRCC